MTRNELVKSYYALVIGTGRIGYTFEHLIGATRSHLGAIRAVTDKPIACCDINIDKAMAASKHFGIDYFGSVKEALDTKTYKVIVVATPTNTHASVINEICEDNYPEIIVCEKPIAMNKEQGEYIIKACRENGIKLVVNHNRRYHPAYKYVKEQLDNEIERNVRAVVGYCYGDPITVGVHMWDLLDWYSYGDESVCYYIDLEVVKYKWWEVSIHTRSNLYRIIETAKDTSVFLADHKLKSFSNIEHYNPMINLHQEVYEIINSDKDIQPSCTGKEGLRALELAMYDDDWELAQRKPRY